jgi:hypothetical protein
VLLAVSTPGFLLSAAEQQPEELRDEKESWTYAVAEFRLKNVGSSAAALRWRFPAMLRDRLRGCPVHHYREDELRARKERLRERRLRELADDITSLSRRLDRLFFETAAEDTIRSLRADREELLQSAEHVRELRPEAISVPAVKPCEHKKGEGAAGLFDPPSVPPWITLRQSSVDCLITGVLEKVDEVIFVDIYAYEADSRSRRLLYSGNFTISEVEEAVGRAAGHVRRRIYGRPWADLRVVTDPPSAEVEILAVQTDEEYDMEAGRSAREHSYRYLPPGEVQIAVRARGYRSVQQWYQLQPGERRSVTVSLEPLATATLRLRTFPQGAEVFRGAVRLGKTPLTVEDAVLPVYLTLNREGYHEKNVLIEGNPRRELLSYRLHPQSVDLEQVIGNARSRFYFGLAGFFLSVPLTMYSYGRSTDYAVTYNSSLGSASQEELQRLNDLSRLWYTAYLGSLFLNGTFLVDMVVQMLNYIDAAQAR